MVSTSVGSVMGWAVLFMLGVLLVRNKNLIMVLLGLELVSVIALSYSALSPWSVLHSGGSYLIVLVFLVCEAIIGVSSIVSFARSTGENPQCD